jgi:hypothetical protein
MGSGGHRETMGRRQMSRVESSSGGMYTKVGFALALATVWVFANLAAGCSDDDGDRTSGPECGDSVAEGQETCDGFDLRGETCVSQGFGGGTLICKADCSDFDTSGCSEQPVCGDDMAAGAEVCDGVDLEGETCVSQGFGSGTLICLPDCSGFDTSGCNEQPVCGDDMAAGAEVCDGVDLRGETCVTQGFGGGTLACFPDCSGFDTSGCNLEPDCGDGEAAGAEVCDGEDLRGETCVTQGFEGGTLACLSDCSGFDTSGCNLQPNCGDDMAAGAEVCDGEDLRGETCVTQGFGGGTLACLSDCSGFDTSDCTTEIVCGDGVAAGSEVCDAPDLRGETCVTQGFGSGTLGCLPDCSDFDTTGCSLEPVCGDGVATGSEVCDAPDLRGETCISLGFSDGTLGCLPDCSDFDTAACIP